jgi:hypothetical protein
MRAWTGDHQLVHRLGPNMAPQCSTSDSEHHLLDHLTVRDPDAAVHRDIQSPSASMVCDVLDRSNIVGKKDLVRISSPAVSSSSSPWPARSSPARK